VTTDTLQVADGTSIDQYDKEDKAKLDSAMNAGAKAAGYKSGGNSVL
jgi:hypothetical protein